MIVSGKRAQAPTRRELLSFPGVLVIVALALVPLFMMLASSFRSDLDGSYTLGNYFRFFSRDFYFWLTWRTIRTSFTITLLCLLIGYPLAYIAAKILRRYQAGVLFLLILPIWISEIIRAYSWLVLLRDGGVLAGFLARIGLLREPALGVLFTPTAYVLALTHIFLPFMVITCFLAIDRIDDRLIESSRVLGASPLKTFSRVVLPLSVPGVISGSLLVFVPCLGAFVEPRILGGTAGTLIGTIIEDQFFEIFGWNFGAAIGTILLAFVLTSLLGLGFLRSVLNRERGADA